MVKPPNNDRRSRFGRKEQNHQRPKKGKGRAKSKRGVNQDLVKSLAHELRAEILAILNERMASPNELAKELDEGLSQVSYHVKVLKDYEVHHAGQNRAAARSGRALLPCYLSGLPDRPGLARTARVRSGRR